MGKKYNSLWFKLDSASRLFVAVSHEKSSNIFRFTCTLHKKIDPGNLQSALDATLKDLSVFRTRLKSGLFWNYLEYNPVRLKIEKDSQRVCQYIDYREYPWYLFRVLYSENQIHLEISHILADGRGAIVFLSLLAYYYLRYCYPKELKDVAPPEKISMEQQTENSFYTYYKNFNLKSPFRKKAHWIRFKPYKSDNGITTMERICNTRQFLELTKQHGATLTEYTAALAIYSIFQEEKDKGKLKHPIRVNIPVNLRKQFPSVSIRNFFACIAVEYACNEETTFDKILASVKEQCKKNLKKNILQKLIDYTVSADQGPTKYVPLFVKTAYLKSAHFRAQSSFTTAVSNIGRFSMIPELKPYIQNIVGYLAPSKYHPSKFFLSSYQDKFFIGFTSFNNTSVGKTFFAFLEAQGLNLTTTENEV